jgi:hypothetical protein
MDELLKVDTAEESAYKESYLKDRATVVLNCLNTDD